MEKTTVGWREYASLPEWGVERIKAKIDTGARTSAIDVADIEEIDDDHVRFHIIIDRAHPRRKQACEAEIVRRARVRSAHGTIHERIVVLTRLRIGPIEKDIELGLVCRKTMLCRMLIGRAALQPEMLVDSAQMYVFGRGGRSRSRRSSEKTSSKSRTTRKTDAQSSNEAEDTTTSKSKGDPSPSNGATRAAQSSLQTTRQQKKKKKSSS